MKITFVSTYVPRRCGIATYSRDLVQALEKRGSQVDVIAVNYRSNSLTYPRKVKAKIIHDQSKTYKQAADRINNSSSDLVCLQHEYGIFGGQDGKNIFSLTDNLSKPIVTTFHTVLAKPNPIQKLVLERLEKQSRMVVVMSQLAAKKLQDIYCVPRSKIDIIHHGAPGITPSSSSSTLDFYPIRDTSDDAFLIMSINLLSENKGLEYVIQALPLVIPTIPHVHFLIVGITHPEVKKRWGETYRRQLKNWIRDLKLESHVSFLNQYVSLAKLQRLLQRCDLYVTPYLNPEQATSGTLAYAVGAGKPCISTPYAYAQELLSGGRGMLVKFRSAESIAQTVIELYVNVNKRRQIAVAAAEYSRQLTWPHIAQRYTTTLKRVVRRPSPRRINSKVSFKHLHFLTDNTGLLQHANLRLPDPRHGYALDDNARALIVVSHHIQRNKPFQRDRLLPVYLKFILSAQAPSGKFHNFMNLRHQWVDSPGLGDSFGRTLWALGYHLYSLLGFQLSATARRLFDQSKPQIPHTTDLRAKAFCIFGLYYRLKTVMENKPEKKSLLRLLSMLANQLVEAYQKNREKGWRWFENCLTYENLRLPQALFMTYLVTQNRRYLRVAIETMEFLMSHIYTKKNYFDFIGQNGWFPKEGQRAIFDQQPVEAGGAVEALLFAHQATGQKSYLIQAKHAFQWFHGRNRHNVSLYDSVTQGVKDGLTPFGTNENQGAESIVSYLMAQLELIDALKAFPI